MCVYGVSRQKEERERESTQHKVPNVEFIVISGCIGLPFDSHSDLAFSMKRSGFVKYQNKGCQLNKSTRP